MSRLFLGYKFTGVPKAELEETVVPLARALSRRHKVFCSYALEGKFRSEGWDPGRIYKWCETQLLNHQTFVAFVQHEEQSNGLLGEFRTATEHGLHRIVLIRSPLEYPELREQAHRVFEYRTVPELVELARTI